MFKNKTLLITGGTGSFGNAVLRKYLNTDIGEIRIFSRDEKKQYDMRKLYNNKKIKYYIGDVRDYESVDNALNGVDFVFHAAALKQVPSCEFYPVEAVKTNVIGAENVLRAARVNHVEKVVVLSTDKAVYPINAMGMTKGLMEKIMISRSRESNARSTLMCGTRYGNVMASRGSVIPLFVKLINEGKDITVTDPKMTRFMMFLDESVDLVTYAFKEGIQGDIFVKKAPSATMGDLAIALRELLGKNVSIKIIGTRHGEKLYETLVNREEMARAEELEDYYRIPADNRDLNYNKYFDEGENEINAGEDYNSHNTERLSISEIKELLIKLEIVQEYIK